MKCFSFYILSVPDVTNNEIKIKKPLAWEIQIFESAVDFGKEG